MKSPPSKEAKVSRSVPARTSPAGLQSFVSGTTLISSEGPAWKDIFIQVFSHAQVRAPFLVPAVAEPLIVWVISGNAIVEERDLGGVWMANRVGVGDFFLTRSEVPYEMRWRVEGTQPFQVMHLYLSLPVFEKAVLELTGRAGIALKDVSGGRDATLLDILRLLHGELTSKGAGGALFVAGLAQSLAVHLVRTYGLANTPVPGGNALPRAKLRHAIAFMEARLAEPFQLQRVASLVGMSEFHFSRLFKKATGLSPSRYFIRQRIAKAQQLLQETDASIIEVALAVGYSSPSHFTQVFHREAGLLPTRYRRGA